MKVTALLMLWVAALTGLYALGRHWAARRRARERVLEDLADTAAAGASPAGEEVDGLLSRWLFRAGFRNPEAARLFLALTAAAAAVGLLLAWAVYSSGLVRESARTLASVPGGVGDILLPLVYLAPWLPLVILSSVPTLVVRAARRKRVAEVEQDLPITLELLATLTEAGLGFDAALDRILRSQRADRALAREFRTFQMEVLAGRPRVQCLRRLGWRLDVMPLTVFLSALVQSEQVGAGVADVLRRQADDLRGRRREDALALAATVPVKLLFPLVICFLPGILIATLGPTLYQIFQFLEGITRSRGLP